MARDLQNLFAESKLQSAPQQSSQTTNQINNNNNVADFLSRHNLSPNNIQSRVSNPNDPDANWERANIYASADLAGGKHMSNIEYRNAVDDYYNQLQGESGADYRFNNGVDNFNPISLLNHAADYVDYGIGTVVDGAWDTVAGGLADAFVSKEAGDTLRNMADAQSVGNFATGIGLSMLGPAGWAALLGKSAVQSSDELYSALSGIDTVTGLELSDDERAAKAVEAALSVGLSAIPVGGAAAKTAQAVRAGAKGATEATASATAKSEGNAVYNALNKLLGTESSAEAKALRTASTKKEAVSSAEQTAKEAVENATEGKAKGFVGRQIQRGKNKIDETIHPDEAMTKQSRELAMNNLSEAERKAIQEATERLEKQAAVRGKSSPRVPEAERVSRGEVKEANRLAREVKPAQAVFDNEAEAIRSALEYNRYGFNPSQGLSAWKPQIPHPVANAKARMSNQMKLNNARDMGDIRSTISAIRSARPYRTKNIIPQAASFMQTSSNQDVTGPEQNIDDILGALSVALGASNYAEEGDYSGR